MSFELKLDHRKYNYSLMSQILSNHGCSLVENVKLINQLQQLSQTSERAYFKLMTWVAFRKQH